jgi:hypothetical protein
MFTKLKAHDQVIGVVWFNRNKDGYDTRVLANGSLDRIGYDRIAHAPSAAHSLPPDVKPF